MIVSQPKASYRYSYVIQVAVLLPVALFILVGYVAYTGEAARDSLVTTILALIVSSLACLALFVYFNRQRVFVHEEGLVLSRLFLKDRQIEWKDVKETRYRQTSLAQDLLMHLGILGALFTPFVGNKESAKKGTQELKVIGAQGSITLSNYFKNVRGGIRTALEQVNPPMLTAMRKQLDQGQEVLFGSLSLNQQGICWKRKRVAFAEIESAKILGREFRVKQSGKWLDAIAVPSQKIPNVFVAIDLIEEKRHGVRLSEAAQSSMAATV